ncbi:hypothetical protein OHC33_006733 [Knufia fluminis]|uniref:Uncharacterized protein n=1 Tax=Knufia fluminis TaxID=191047 RepID=A0AAN8ELN3_9EURO|nr:hypothetical protein OHC33_006733 [Knufia fluminis]
MEAAPYVLNAVTLGTQHYDKVRNPAQKRWEKMRGRVPKDDPDIVDSRTMEEKGYVLRRRSQVQPDEKIVEVVRHKGEVLPRRPRNRRQTSSMDGRYPRDFGGYGSDSEGSIPPRGRRARSIGGRSRRGKSSSSSSSSSDLGSSTDEEHEMKKMRRKKWITASLASVATIHAASKVYSSIESHDKRIIAVQQGEISPEEAHKQSRNARWQDAAAIGLAVLGIKGAISEWKEMAEEHEKHKELCEQHELQHKRRLEHLRRQRAKECTGYYKGRDGQWYYDGPSTQDSLRSRSRYQRSEGSQNTYDQLAGPRQNDRKMIEGPSRRDRSVYGRDQSRSAARSNYDRDRSDDRSPVRRRSPSRNKKHCSKLCAFANNPLAVSAAAAPLLGAAAYKFTKVELTNDTFLKMNPEREEYLKKYKADQHGEFKDFAQDTLEEVLDHL